MFTLVSSVLFLRYIHTTLAFLIEKAKDYLFISNINASSALLKMQTNYLKKSFFPNGVAFVFAYNIIVYYNFFLIV